MTEQITDKQVDEISASFSALELKLGSEIHNQFNQQRKAAFEQFLALGLPTTKNEEWRYTNISPLFSGKTNFEPETLTANLDSSILGEVSFEDCKANVLVFINGKFAPSASSIHSPIHEVEILTLAQAEKKRVGAFDTYFGTVAKNDINAFQALNSAFATQGTFIYVPEGQTVELPIIIHHIADGNDAKTIAHPRNLFVLGKNSKATIVQTFASQGSNHVFTNSLTEVQVEEGASLELVIFQTEKENATQVNNTEINQLGNSHSNVTTITTGGKMVRNNLHIAVNGEYVEANLNGLYCLNSNRLVDNHTLVDHIEPNSQSNELYKGIADDKGTAVFNGKIFVKSIAQKTNAFQSNRNILLSPDATVNTKPQLEIFADDVRCTHGATTGAMDEEPMFYLRSRGLDEKTARAMLLHAFAQEVVEKINHAEIKQTLAAKIDALLGFESAS